MATPVFITIACLVGAIACTVLAERHHSGRHFPLAALVGMYGACVGIVSSLLVHFFALGVVYAILLGLPLGVLPLLMMVVLAR